MSYVFVLDTEQRPLDPVHPGHARRLLTCGRAAVWRRYPFTIILKRAVPEAAPAPLRLKIDPGSRTTGLALVTEAGETAMTDEGRVVWAGELTHRGQAVHEALVTRAGRVLSRDQLMDVCYGNDSPAFDRSIDVCIARLRKKLLDNSRNPATIRTVRNGGYIFAARVTRAGNGQHEWRRAG